SSPSSTQSCAPGRRKPFLVKPIFTSRSAENRSRKIARSSSVESPRESSCVSNSSAMNWVQSLGAYGRRRGMAGRVSEMWAGVQGGPCIRPRFPLEGAFRLSEERVARKKGRGPGMGGGGPSQKPGTPSGGGGGWAPLRDALRRDVEQAVAALAFAERLHQKMDTQRRAFLDFPRVMEQLRSGAMERLTASLSRLYEGGQGFDLHRFLRDLPLALAQLATADKNKSQPPPAGLGPQASGLGPSPETEHQPEPSQPPAPEPAPAQIPEP